MQTREKLSCLLLLLLSLSPGPAEAQVNGAMRPSPPSVDMRGIEQEPSTPTWKLVAGGVVGGAVGYGVLYYGLKPGTPNPEAEFVSEADVRDFGAWVGMSAGIPIGTHVANGWRGSWGWSLLASLGIGVLGGVLTMTQDSPVFLVLTPAAQIWVSTEIAKSDSR